MVRPGPPHFWWLNAAAQLCLIFSIGWLALPAQAQAVASPTALRLHITGSLAGLNLYTRHEEPFWTAELARLSSGRYTAEIVPFDRAGIRGQDMLSLLRLGTVPYGTMLLNQASSKDLELSAPDLAGLNPDMAALRRTTAAFRPHLQDLLRERHGIELLAVYAYPAQELFCSKAFASLEALKGRRIRTSSVTQSDWVQALGAQPVTIAFADMLANLRSGNIDCAITGTMSGNTIGLPEHTVQMHTMAVSWGLSIFAANGAAWSALPADLRALLLRELPRLEAAVWDEAQKETDQGIACNVGAPECRGGKPGRMTELKATPADDQRRREIFATAVLPRWLQRCGPACVEVWNRTLRQATGFEAKPAP
jgi:TRAP-type C4-dicarboxylate transport system substrate-binding protein